MTPSNSFQARIVLVLVLLLTAVIGLLYVAVQAATSEAVRRQADEQLAVGVKVFHSLLDTRDAQLRDALQVLAADFGFKDAVASGDVPTIRSVLENHGARVGASEVLLLGLDGQVRAATGDGIAEGAPFAYSDLLRNTQGKGAVPVVLINDLPAQLVQAVVKAPLPIGRVVMAFPLDLRLANEFRELTLLDLTFAVIRDGAVVHAISTLPPASLETWRQQMNPGMEQQALTLGDDTYLGQRLLLADGGGQQIIASMQRSMNAALLGFLPLKAQILWIALGALGASLIGALLLARNISRPLQRLARAAERIGHGDYALEIDLSRRDELGALAKAFQQMQDGLAERERLLSHNALHDTLTGLPNRALILERLGSAVEARRSVALLHLGVEDFRSINEGLGTAGGDAVLRQMAQLLSAAIRPGDSVARLVGDEFLLLVERTDQDGAVAIADELQALMEQPLRIGAHDLTLRCRLGIAAYPADGDSPEDLMRRAGIAMRDAAEQPGRLQLYQEGRDAAHERQVTLIRDLRHAAEREELLLHFQPKLDLRSGRSQRAEALLRWRHPAFGMVSPGEFIPLAERTGSISRLTAWVVGEVVRQLAEWNTRGLCLEVSLNVSSQDLLDSHLVERIANALVRHGVPATQVVFEITESALMEDPEHALSVLQRLRALGIQLSVDDFGTGYSSLAQLRRMPVQELKIDQSFIRDLDETSSDAVIVRSTLDMSHNLGLTVVAEGVEYEHSLRLLERWGCDLVQGYFISRPLPPADFERWLGQFSASPSLELMS